MRIDVFTLFPEWFEWFRGQRHMANVLETGTELRTFHWRETTPLTGGQVDDSPYGGGAGMVLRVDVVDTALQAAYAEGSELILEIKVADSDLGRVIGKEGRVAKSIRTIARAAGAREERRISVDIVED